MNHLKLILATSLTFAAGFAYAQPNAPDTYDAHYARAKALAGTEYQGLLRQCTRIGAPQPAPPAGANAGRRGGAGQQAQAEPAKVFDNLYYVGTSGVSAWAVTTSQGIIVIDALNNPEEAKTYIDGGLRKLGLNPDDIKYVIVTHGHGDHFGGASYLKSAHGAHVVASKIDWQMMEDYKKPQKEASGAIGPDVAARWGKLAPAHELDAADGGKLTLGDTSIEFYVTPGHTPGALSMLVPVRDGGTSHLAALWGGVGFNFTPTPELFNIYAGSAEKFAAITRSRGADVVISNHPGNNDTFAKITALKARGPGQANPFVVGNDSAVRFVSVLGECARAASAKVSGKI